MTSMSLFPVVYTTDFPSGDQAAELTETPVNSWRDEPAGIGTVQSPQWPLPSNVVTRSDDPSGETSWREKTGKAVGIGAMSPPDIATCAMGPMPEPPVK